MKVRIIVKQTYQPPAKILHRRMTRWISMTCRSDAIHHPHTRQADETHRWQPLRLHDCDGGDPHSGYVLRSVGAERWSRNQNG